MERLGRQLPVDQTGKISAYFENLSQTFDNQWAQELRVDPLLVLGGVQNTIANLVGLGQILTVVGGSASLPSELVGRLRSPTEFRAAWYELQVGSCFIQAFHDVELYPHLPSGSVPDGVVRFREAPVYYDAHLAKNMFLSPQMETAMRRLLEKYRQLPSGEFGVLIMDSVLLLTPDDIQAALNRVEKIRPGQRTRIAGIILANKTIERSGFIRALPTVILRSPDAQPFLDLMAQALAAFPDFP